MSFVDDEAFSGGARAGHVKEYSLLIEKVRIRINLYISMQQYSFTERKMILISK